jgi:hypothetical protein
VTDIPQKKRDYKIIHYIYESRSRDSVVGIATGYGWGDGGVGVRVPIGARIFFSLRCPDRLWRPPRLIENDGGSFPRVKAAGA